MYYKLRLFIIIDNMFKDMSPLAAYDKSNAVFGTLTDDKGNPIANATIKIDGTDIRTTTNESRYVSFNGVTVEEKSVDVTIISSDDVKELSCAAIVNEKNARSKKSRWILPVKTAYID